MTRNGRHVTSRFANQYPASSQAYERPPIDLGKPVRFVHDQKIKPAAVADLGKTRIARPGRQRNGHYVNGIAQSVEHSVGVLTKAIEPVPGEFQFGLRLLNTCQPFLAATF